MDNFTKFIWFYLLKQKTEVSLIVPKFKALVENFFQKLIFALYNGGEYMKLIDFLSNNDISHSRTPPHTP